jgi:acetyl-CoA carboxylase/biotin carboxylase 1
MILANWRGFSGGQRDMYDQVLKFGSDIVDALREFNQPIFIYIPPFGELRGGSWVVLDSSINPQMIEMYADSNSRAGILETSGIVEIKYRKPQILLTMERTDLEYKRLNDQLKSAHGTSEKSIAKQKLEAYIVKSLPIYQQMARHFADLHDTPGRMKSKKAIREIVDWKDSRRFFYYRLIRRLKEEELMNAMKNVLHRKESKNVLIQWYKKDTNLDDFNTNDLSVYKWIQGNSFKLKDLIQKVIQEKQMQSIINQIMELNETEKEKIKQLLQK